MNKTKQLARVKKLYDLYHAGKILTLAEHEVHPHLPKGSRENYLYFTLAPALNFQRSSPTLWQSALKTYQDSETQYLFFPEKVSQKTFTVIQKDLLRHGLALQKNKHPDIWIRLSRTFEVHFKSDPRELFQQCQWDVRAIHKTLQQDLRKEFPYLSGPKMANYWLYILSCYTDASFYNMDEISIIPDTHVLQSSAKLNLGTKTMTPVQVANLWKELLKGSGIAPVEMHPVLWNWSRNNFFPEV